MRKPNWVAVVCTQQKKLFFWIVRLQVFVPDLAAIFPGLRSAVIQNRAKLLSFWVLRVS